MKYKILEIMPAQIRVEYEDKTWAIVPIRPDATLEDIDDAVSRYDKDFLPNPETLINKNISVGDERTSTKKIVINDTNNSGIGSTEVINDKIISFGAYNPINAVLIGNYYAERGDNRIKDIIDQKIQEFVSDSSFSVDNVIYELTYDPNDIFMQAVKELESGATANG
jgi:hypothetical protein